MNRFTEEFLRLHPKWSPEDAEGLLGQFLANVREYDERACSHKDVKVSVTGPRSSLAWVAKTLREARGATGWSMDTAAERLAWSRSKLARAEAGRTSITLGDAELVIREYGIEPLAADELRQIVRGSGARGKGR